MADLIRVSTSRIGSDAESLGRYAQLLRENLTKLFDGIQSLNSMWEGDAHNEFVRSAADDKERMENLIQKIEEIKIKFDEAKQEYEKCESTVANEVASIQV